MLKKLFLISLSISPLFFFGQEQDWGEVHGDFNFSGQTYTEDPSINAAKVDEFFWQMLILIFVFQKEILLQEFDTKVI